MTKTKVIAGFVDCILGKNMPADSTLRSMKKDDLIGHIRVANHNYRVLLDTYSRVSKIAHEQAAEIDKLNKDNAMLREMLQAMSGLPSEKLNEEVEFDHCTVTQCYYNNDLYCTCCDDVRDASMLEDCPSYMED